MLESTERVWERLLLSTADMNSGSSSEDDLRQFKARTEDDEPQQWRSKRLYAPDYNRDHDHHLNLASRKKERYWLGLDPDKPLKPHESGSEKFFWCRVRTTFQEPFSEFLGTMVLACFYMGSIAQSTLGANISTAPGGE